MAAADASDGELDVDAASEVGRGWREDRSAVVVVAEGGGEGVDVESRWLSLEVVEWSSWEKRDWGRGGEGRADIGGGGGSGRSGRSERSDKQGRLRKSEAVRYWLLRA